MKLTDFKALTFDCYGTLIDWESGMIEALKPLTSKVSRALTRNQILETHARHESSQQVQTPAKLYRELLPIVYRRLAEEWGVSVGWNDCVAYGLDEDEFLSPYGIRALSRHHAEHPFVFFTQGQEYRVNYLPAESDTGMFGGNSNWRGPIWMPVNALVVRALLQYYLYYGDTFKVECPTGSGNLMNLFEVSREIANRLTRIFLRDQSGRRPVYGGPRNSRPIRTGATTSSSTSISMAITERASAPVTRPGGPGSWRN
jgi:Glycosyl hydrolase family 63 C-terminal domain